MSVLQTKCKGGQASYGRRKRSTESQSLTRPYDAQVTEVSQETMPDELPLQLSIIVHSPVVSTADRLSSRDTSFPDTVLITGRSKGPQSPFSCVSGYSKIILLFPRLHRRPLLRGRQPRSRSADLLADRSDPTNRGMPAGSLAVPENCHKS